MSFLEALQDRIVETGEGEERTALEQLYATVLDFGEEVAEGMAALQPIVEAGDEAVGKAKAAAAAVTSEAKAGTGPARTAAPPLLESPSGRDAEETASNRLRFRTQQLLDAAFESAAALDKLLEEMHADLDKSFFEHLQWEIAQQIERNNRPLLDLLELLVQRACAQIEAGAPELRLLTSLLYTRSSESRAQLFIRDLALADPQMQQRFASAVEETRMTLEKALLRGEDIDRDLLQQLRLIALEMQPHLARAGLGDYQP